MARGAVASLGSLRADYPLHCFANDTAFLLARTVITARRFNSCTAIHHPSRLVGNAWMTRRSSVSVS